MRDPKPTTQTIRISEVQSRLPNLVDEVSRQETRILVEKSGSPVAALVSIEDLDRLAQFDRTRAERFAALDRMREQFAGIPAEEIDREADRAVAELRAASYESA